MRIERQLLPLELEPRIAEVVELHALGQRTVTNHWSERDLVRIQPNTRSLTGSGNDEEWPHHSYRFDAHLLLPRRQSVAGRVHETDGVRVPRSERNELAETRLHR